jgi:hypothetical protein
LGEKHIPDKDKPADRQAYQEQEGWGQDKEQCSLLQTSWLKYHNKNNLCLPDTLKYEKAQSSLLQVRGAMTKL